jgi:hypothetical protein
MQHCDDHDKCATNATLMWAVGVLLVVSGGFCGFFTTRFASTDAVAGIDKRLERMEAKVDRLLENRLIIGRTPNQKKDDNPW